MQSSQMRQESTRVSNFEVMFNCQSNSKLNSDFQTTNPSEIKKKDLNVLRTF